MKGIVAELNEKYAIVLTQDGTFRKVKVKAGMTVGCEIDLNQSAGKASGFKQVTRIASIAAAALFALGIGYGAYSYTIPYSYIDVDINPSVELTVNRFDRIINTEAFNEDGKKLLENSSLRNAKLEEGIAQLLGKAVEQGYLKAANVNSGDPGDEDERKTATTGSSITTGGSVTTGGAVTTGAITMDKGQTALENAVLLTVSSTDKRKSGELKKDLARLAGKELEKESVNSKVLVGQTSIAQRDDARKYGVTPGKLALIEDALENEPGLGIEDLKGKAVKDLIQQAKEKKDKENQKGTAKDDGSNKNTAPTSENGDNGHSGSIQSGKSANQAQSPAPEGNAGTENGNTGGGINRDKTNAVGSEKKNDDGKQDASNSSNSSNKVGKEGQSVQDSDKTGNKGQSVQDSDKTGNKGQSVQDGDKTGNKGQSVQDGDKTGNKGQSVQDGDKIGNDSKRGDKDQNNSERNEKDPGAQNKTGDNNAGGKDNKQNGTGAENNGKQQRQKLKDELLKQVQDLRMDKGNKSLENGQTSESAVKRDEKNGGKKNTKGSPKQSKGR